jgi:hypothetical protein
MALICIFLSTDPEWALTIIMMFKMILVFLYLICRPYKVRIFNFIRILNEIAFYCNRFPLLLYLW